MYYPLKISVFSAVAIFLLIRCDGSNSTSPDTPKFGNLSKLGEGKIYVAYPFTDRWKKKLDTVSLSFEYNSSKVKSISVTTTLDSGKTWLPLKTFTANNSNNETIIWVPKNSSTVPKYFGVKRCLIRIKDSEKDEFIDSDTFSLIGAIPMVLLDSLKNNTYQTTDSIKVQYGANMDLASNIQTYFKTDSMKNWVEFVRDINLPSPDAPTILNRQKCLILQTVDSMVKSEAQNFTQPIKILLKDYSATSYYIITDYITIDVM